MKHLFKQGSNDHPVLLLLHGTGGTEKDLLPIADRIDPDASVLSVRGNVVENGMPRFFKRLAEGVFDEQDLVKQTAELNQFISVASERYNFNRDTVVAIGYSNGANIAASLLFHYKNVFKGAVLHHPMVPLRDISRPMQIDIPIFIGAGVNDPLCAPEETTELEGLLTSQEAVVTVHWEENGHQLSHTELNAAKDWYTTNLLNQ
ncbi:phospholipase/carboxylesterase [Amphibacillus marinus]|uniref:Phospholipase/carboxylesterase n=1 Tax=Amphibacillus marinus TaxID=872970 RepID=A0A1H8IF86_9BACI|nr:alpha/beta hydrolase [Amphibacillus marinus]SEN66969.1 phospholipase/carboxylesterase [Amphibacillus marinus]